MAQSASARCLAAYIYAAAGAGESTTEVAWDGQVMIYENGVCLAEAERFPEAGQSVVADIDLDLLRQERMRMGTFDDNRRTHGAATEAFRTISFRLAPPGGRSRPGNGASSVFPSCRPTPRGSSRIATRPTTSRFPAWCKDSARLASSMWCWAFPAAWIPPML